LLLFDFLHLRLGDGNQLKHGELIWREGALHNHLVIDELLLQIVEVMLLYDVRWDILELVCFINPFLSLEILVGKLHLSEGVS